MRQLVPLQIYLRLLYGLRYIGCPRCNFIYNRILFSKSIWICSHVTREMILKLIQLFLCTWLFFFFTAVCILILFCNCIFIFRVSKLYACIVRKIIAKLRNMLYWLLCVILFSTKIYLTFYLNFFLIGIFLPMVFCSSKTYCIVAS